MTLIEVDKLLALFGDWYVEEGTEEGFIGTIKGLIETVPTIEQPHWTPCSERLPRTNGVYNVTRCISDGFECRNISDACYYDGANTWHDDTRVNHERRYLTDVVAWMPLPEPARRVKNEQTGRSNIEHSIHS